MPALSANAAPIDLLEELQLRLSTLVPIAQPVARETEDQLFSADDTDHVVQIITHLEQLHPEAGPHFWSARTWGLISWQPALLALAATYLLPSRLTLSGLLQRHSNGSVAGYYLTKTQPLVPLSIKDALHHNAAELRMLSNRLLNTLSSLRKTNQRLCLRLLADRVLASLLRLQSVTGMDNREIQTHATSWLEALQLPDASALRSITAQGGQSLLMLDRKACCQEFRCANARLCRTCPRRSLDQRIALKLKDTSDD
ncbi:hypothetical protein ADIMK_3109 [Marinobacterium lacunae]|uniref:Ferric siderophore reductase C-terminal domain-containing protein n=1 Tax=Marinobacterium lacunae TaxID=1232683 RepID=A0A081FVT2_9GAMM|nr:siderophore ferric iron reductase [Marinobacterium lacunae]KEA62637.1 hypothetical protein ADIMK_3109 [Marinobacterium lacunae]